MDYSSLPVNLIDKVKHWCCLFLFSGGGWGSFLWMICGSKNLIMTCLFLFIYLLNVMLEKRIHRKWKIYKTCITAIGSMKTDPHSNINWEVAPTLLSSIFDICTYDQRISTVYSPNATFIKLSFILKIEIDKKI